MTTTAAIAAMRTAVVLSLLAVSAVTGSGPRGYPDVRETVELPEGIPPLLEHEDCNSGGVVVEQDPYYRAFEGSSDPEYPQTPFDLSSQVFVNPFRNTEPAQPTYTDTCGLYGNPNICMDTYNITINVANHQLLPASICPKGTAMLLYNNSFPGPTFHVPLGRMTFIRYSNNVDTNDTSHPFGAVEQSWGEDIEEKRPLLRMCDERQDRTGSPKAGKGRAFVVHHHGLESLAPFDGWAEDIFCFGEYKDYVLPGSAASTFWYHDHALGTTSENGYYGLQGLYLQHPCKEPYNLGKVPMHQIHLIDAVLDSECQLLFDRAGPHHNDVWGDINMVNGVLFSEGGANRIQNEASST